MHRAILIDLRYFIIYILLSVVIRQVSPGAPFLLTWFNFNPSMDK